MPVTQTVRLDLTPLRELRRRVSADLRGNGGGPIAQVLTKKWPERFFAFQRQKFTQNSSGGGDWPPLAESTLAQKKREGSRGTRMLRVTDAIYDALFPGRPGNVIRRKGVGGVEMGIGGNDRHPDTNMTIGRLAQIHNEGRGNVPKRQVMYPVDVGTAGQMFNDMAIGFRRLVSTLPKLRNT